MRGKKRVCFHNHAEAVLTFAKGRGGGPHRGNRYHERHDYEDVKKSNRLMEKYYDLLPIVPEDEKKQFWDFMRTELPNSFRFTGSKG